MQPAKMPKKFFLKDIHKTCLGCVFTTIMFICFLVTELFRYNTYNIINCDSQYVLTFIRLSAQGQKPYLDFAALQTPLSFIISGILFKPFQDWPAIDQYRILFIYYIILRIINALAVYYCCRKLDIQQKWASLCAGSYLILSLQYANIYDYFAVFFLVMAFTSYLSYVKTEKKRYLLLISLFCCLCFFSKQQIGLYSIAIIGLSFVWRWSKREYSPSQAIKQTLYLLGAFFFFTLCGLFILWENGSLNSFFEYCFLGISDFVIYPEPWRGFIILASISSLIYIKNRRMDILFLSLISALGTFPLPNNRHIFAYSYGVLIYLFHTIDTEHIKTNDKSKFYIKACSIILAASLIFLPHYSKKEIGQMIENAQGIHTTRDFMACLFGNNAIILMDYMETKDSEEIKNTHIVDNTGGFWDIYLNRYDKYYNMFLKGNLGQKKPLEVIQETSNDPQSVFILRTPIMSLDMTMNKSNYFIQFPYETKEWIDDNMILKEILKNKEGEPVWNIYVPSEKHEQE